MDKTSLANLLGITEEELITNAKVNTEQRNARVKKLQADIATLHGTLSPEELRSLDESLEQELLDPPK